MSCWPLRRRSILTMQQRLYHRAFLLLIPLAFLAVVTVRLYSTDNRLQLQPQLCSPGMNLSLEQTQQRRDYNTSSLKPIIFIGGMPRSGTTLMRAILDSHPSVRCGEETRIIPRILSMRLAWKKSTVEWNRLMAGGMTEKILDSAVRAFVYEVLFHHSQYSDILCEKDPFVLKYATYTSSIFPRSKFLFVIRDARAVIHSVITRKVTITGFSSTDYRQDFKLWNKGIELMYEQCQEVGPTRCLMVYYEKLVLQPKKTIGDILKFLDVPWVESVLHHEELVGKKISLSKTEHSSDQVVKPINLEALTKWMGHIPMDILGELDILAPMLRKLGYDTTTDTPTYGVAEQIVLDNMKQLKDNAEFWDAKAKSYARQPPNSSSSFSNGSHV